MEVLYGFKVKLVKKILMKDIFSRLDFPKQKQLVNSGGEFLALKQASEKSQLLDGLQKRTIQKELPEIYQYVGIQISPNHEVHWRLNNEDPFFRIFKRFG